jgi:hypothetical protein
MRSSTKVIHISHETMQRTIRHGRPGRSSVGTIKAGLVVSQRLELAKLGIARFGRYADGPPTSGRNGSIVFNVA